MKTAIVIADGIKQIMFTAEDEIEEMALKMITPDVSVNIEAKIGSFYDKDTQSLGYHITQCKGGYLRAYKDNNSLMIVLRPKVKTERPNAPEDRIETPS